MRDAAQELARRVLPDGSVGRAKARYLHARPPVGLVRFGSLRRVRPISATFGYDRGTPVDRYYIERFLAERSADGDIRGRVLEVGDDTYSRRYGGSGPASVDTVDVLDIDAGNPRATIVGDLARPGTIAGVFDCVICTQTLLLIYDVRAAVETLHGLLAPGGVALVTVPGISKICRPEADRFGDYWRFTGDSLGRLLRDRFGEDNVTVETKGNVLSAVSFLHGLATEELKAHELDLHDPDYEVIVAARAIKR